MKLWECLGFRNQQSYAAKVGANKRRIAAINQRLAEIGWLGGEPSEEGDKLDAEKGRLLDEITAPLLCVWHLDAPDEPRCDKLVRGFVRARGTGQTLASCSRHLEVASILSHGYEVLM